MRNLTNLVSVSYQISPLMKLVAIGKNKVFDAYSSPILRRHIDRVWNKLLDVKLMLMKSDIGLVNADKFYRKDSILSGLIG